MKTEGGFVSRAEQGGPALLDLTLKVGEDLLEVELRVPRGPSHLVDLLPAIMALDDALLDLLSRRLENQGEAISCAAGCAACCRQVVPLSEAEAQHLARLVARATPPRRARLQRRFREALAALEGHGLLARLRRAAELTGRPERRQLGLDYHACGVACPFLENESCGIYPDRPLGCREYLVSSPAANCAEPATKPICRVEIPVMVSAALHRGGGASWIPLPLALEAAPGEPLEPARPGTSLVQEFLQQVAEAAPECVVLGQRWRD